MDHRTHAPEDADSAVRRLQRYADRSRPPAPWVYVVTGVVLGVAISLFGILPGIWAALLVAVVAAAGVGYDRWLLQHHGVPKLRDLPAAVRREQQALIIVAAVVGSGPLLLTSLVAGLDLIAGAATSGLAVAVLLGIGGPILDRRARCTAAELLEQQPSNGPDHTSW